MLSLLGRIAGKSLAEAITEEYETERSLEGLKVALCSITKSFYLARHYAYKHQRRSDDDGFGKVSYNL